MANRIYFFNILGLIMQGVVYSYNLKRENIRIIILALYSITKCEHIFLSSNILKLFYNYYNFTAPPPTCASIGILSKYLW